MHRIDEIYINGQFVRPQGDDWFDLYNPANEALIGQVRLASAADAQAAIAAARAAFPAQARRSREERIAMLERMRDALKASEAELMEAVIEEYGAPMARSQWMASYPWQVVEQIREALRDYRFEETVGQARVSMQPLGVAGLITPWNSNAGFIAGKLATALAAGCTTVIKPSEMSALQTQVVTRALHAAGLPAGVFNIVTGRGEVVGETISRSPEVAKISFTGSTAVGQAILRNAADHFTRVTLELGGKSPTLVLPDADPASAAALAVAAGFINSGQACIAGSRILVPAARQAEWEQAIGTVAAGYRSGDPRDPATTIGPMVSARQWQRVQDYIQLGQREGARLLVGGADRPEGHARGWLVRPTVFTDVHNDMRIAREEIFGPVLCLIPYRDEAQALAIANDTRYGLSGLVLGADPAHAGAVAAQIESGRVQVNTLAHEPRAPFGGFKHSGIGREMGRWGIDAYLEPRTIIGAV